MSENISVRELQKDDIDLIVQYWLDSEDSFLKGMGVDLAKMPTKEEWIEMLTEQLNTAFKEKKFYYMIWMVEDKPVGHSNVNKIVFGQEAYMHLHLWKAGVRKKGLGAELVKRTLPYFFENFELKMLYCEPYAFNPAPNKTLQKVGFEFVKEYVTIPGWINFEQPVNRWQMSYAGYQELKLNKVRRQLH